MIQINHTTLIVSSENYMAEFLRQTTQNMKINVDIEYYNFFPPRLTIEFLNKF